MIEGIVVTLLERLSTLYESLIIALEMMAMEYMMTRFNTQNMKTEECRAPRQRCCVKTKQVCPPPWQGVRTCFHCNKLGHIARFYYNTKKEKENAKNAMGNDNFIFAMQHGAH